MGKYRPYILVVLAGLLAWTLPAYSQADIKTVSGVITSAEDNSPIADGITVYTYMTTAAAHDDFDRIRKMLEENSLQGYVFSGTPNTTIGNYYSVQVPSTGALIFFYEDARVLRLEEVRGRLEINISLKVARQLQRALIEAETTRPIVVLESIPISGDNEIASEFTFLFPSDARGRSDARFAIQAFLLGEDRRDTLQFFEPIVLDGEAYHLTQLRRKNYDPQEDILFPYAQQARNKAGEPLVLTDSTVSVTYPFRFKLDSREDIRYFCYKYWLEDYNLVYAQDSAQVFSTARLQDPMQFLEYNLDSFNLDPADFFVDAQRERHTVKRNLPLRFMVGKSRIDPADTAGLRVLEEIRSEIADIASDSDASLQEMYISGVASPEGNNANNQQLAKARMNYLLDNILSVLSNYNRERVYQRGTSRVAEWTEVAEILERDSLFDVAAKVRSIAAGYRDMDGQNYRIQRLPEYREYIVPRLESLRSVTCTYESEVYRKLLPEEILEKYLGDPDYRNGKKRLTLNEYWNLYNLLDNQEELEELYRRGIVSAQEMSYFWPLPANNLAVSYIQRGQVDTTLLKPYLHEGFAVNRSIMNMADPTKTDRIWNLDPIVANQVVMLLNAHSSRRAAFWATYLKNIPKYKTLYHVARCLAGYYQVDNVDGRETFLVVSQSSDRNAAVMNMAVRSWANAEKALQRLPQEDALTQYLWAQFLSRKFGGGRDYGRMQGELYAIDDFGMETMVSDKAKDCLKEAFRLDDGYRVIAQKDAFLPEDLVAEAAFEWARDNADKFDLATDYLAASLRMNRNILHRVQETFPDGIVAAAREKANRTE